MKRIIIFALLISSKALYSQGLPNTVFASLKFNPSARLGSLGTNFSTSYDPKIDLAISNASLISPALHNTAMINYTDYFQSYSTVHAAYARKLPKIGLFLASLQYVNFGLVDAYDESGNYLGVSNRYYDMTLNVAWGKALVDSMFSIGANFKYIFSRGENFWMNGLAADVSATYINIDKRFSASLMFQNIGTVLKNNFLSDYQKMPFQINLAVYQRMKHAPFAYSITLTNLQKWNLSGTDPNEQIINSAGDTTTPNKVSTFADNLMRHFVPGIEILPFKNFAFRLSYNYHRRQELKTSTRPGFTGFSWGIGLKVYKIQIDYARSAFHLAGAPNYITISTNLNTFKLQKN